ncbi:hypothetical protein [Terrisporobacter sp.]
MWDRVFIVYISIAVIFLIYSIILCRKKRIIYTIGREEISVLKDDYYKIQLLFCVFNSILLILESAIFYNNTNMSLFACYYVITFWIVNYLLKFIAIKMNYLNKSYE